MAFRLLGCLFLVAAGTAGGAMLSKRLYRRRDFLKSFSVFISALETRLRYCGDDIFLLVNACAAEQNLSCLSVKARGKPFDVLWSEQVERAVGGFALTENDISLLREFGLKLGKTDVEGQLKHLELYEISFGRQLTRAEEAIEKKSKLYKVMGFFAGSAAALLLA